MRTCFMYISNNSKYWKFLVEDHLIKMRPTRPAYVGRKASNIIAGFKGNEKTVKFKLY